MLMIAFIGFTKRDIQYKIFAYMTVYYILYLLGALLPTDALLMNIGFSMFSYLIIVAALEVMQYPPHFAGFFLSYSGGDRDAAVVDVFK